MKEKKGAIVLGIGALLGGLFLIFRKGKPALAEPPPNGIVVALWNPPKEATKWLMNILNWDVSRYLSSGALGITEPAIFEVEQDWFPLRIEIRIEDAGGVIIYYVQSFSITEDYTEVFIPDYGSYYYNVSKERFEH